jgi:hypothetical protein
MWNAEHPNALLQSILAHAAQQMPSHAGTASADPNTDYLRRIATAVENPKHLNVLIAS